MIYTSYFGNYRHLPLEKCISIARKTVGNIATYPKLFPPEYLLFDYKRGKITVGQYVNLYKVYVLGELDPYQTYKELDGSILLCYETPEKFCHRHIVKAWFKHYGLECEEYCNYT